MATLFNTKISATYEGLLKTIDNAAISASLKELTDGSGNQSGLFLNTSGDFKVTSVLEWGSLKDTGTGVTITQFVTAANGIENFNNDTTLPTSAAVKLYVDTKFSGGYTLTEVLGFGNTTSGKDIAVSAGDDVTFSDTSKILIGAGSDLQIYKDGSNGKILHSGIGLLEIASNGVVIRNAANNENMITAVQNGEVTLYFDNDKKLETTTTGFTVTGRISGMTNPTLAQDAATKSYVDNIVTIQDLDFDGNIGSGQVDLDTQSFIIEGNNGIETTASSNALIIDGSVLSTGIATNSANIVTNVINIAANVTNISNNVNAISINTTDIGVIKLDILNNEAAISSNSALIASNSALIATAYTLIAGNESTGTINTSSILTNEANIATNVTNIATNDTNIGNNATNITANFNAIASNNTDIAANTAAIAAHPIIINGLVNNLGSQG